MKKITIHSYKILFTILSLTLFCVVIFKIVSYSELPLSQPTLVLHGDKTVCLCPKDEYTEEGYSAFYGDLDLTNQVVVQDFEDYILYLLTVDQQVTKKYRTVVREDNAPVILLKGKETEVIKVHTKWVDPGYIAVDQCDGRLTKKVIVTQQVNTNVTGEYDITYEVTDQSGNTTVAHRTVIVKEEVAPVKTIYLTFDDGPGNVTEEILDILKEENVPATFFVTETAQEYLPLITRAYMEGHTIGLHSATHQYHKIYKSMNDYLNDFDQLEKTVQKLIPEKTTIMRFPGGSSNTVSNRSQGLMSRLTAKVTDMGYTYYDWDIDSLDSMNVSGEEIYRNVTSKLKENQANIVLLHDYNGNKNTKNVLRRIIQYGKQQGYTFLKIDETTPRVIHDVRN